MSPLTLPLAYGPDVCPTTLARLERAARRLGLPLADLEALGQREEDALAFVRATRRLEQRLVRPSARVRPAVLDRGRRRPAERRPGPRRRW